MSSWDELDAILATDPQDVGCEHTWQLIDVYVECVLRGDSPEEQFPGITAHLRACDPCSEDYRGLVNAVLPADSPSRHRFA